MVQSANAAARDRIREYAAEQANQVRNRTKCSCHAMADIWGYATQFYKGRFNNDEESFVEDVSFILAGVNEWCTVVSTQNVGRRIFTDNGFKRQFRDGSNQVQHFSAGVMAGFQYGHWGGALHRIVRPDTPEDTALNDQSSAMGAGLDGIGVSLEEVQGYIEENVCEMRCGVCNGGRGR